MDDRLKGQKEKAVVFGMLNRDTKKVKSIKVKSSEYHNLGNEIINNIAENSTLVTDGYSSYKTLDTFYKHKTINHHSGEYVKQDGAFKIHTNGIEGYWSIVKRTIDGTYYWVSKKHMQKYLAEIDMRYNNRELELAEQFDFLLTNSSGRLSYKNLIKN